MLNDPSGGYFASFPSKITAGAGWKVEQFGLSLRISADFTNVPLLTVAPAAGHVLVQDPSSGQFNRLDLGNLPTTVPQDGSVTNVKFAAAPPLTLKGNATNATAQPQDLTPTQAKSALALEQVDNTPDAAKPVSAAQAAAIAARLAATSNLADLSNASAARGNLGLGNVDNTSDAAKPVSTAQAAALAGRLQKLGDDVTANPDNSIADKVPFANTAAKHYLLSRRNGPANALLGTTSIIRNTVGSGTFGPAAADYALLLSSVKDGAFTATGADAKEGEVDTLIVIGHQGKKGDLGGVIIDVEKRRDAVSTPSADETGGIAAIEANVGLRNAAGQQYHRMHPILGFAESPNGTSGGRGFGAHMETRAGEWFSAYHAGSFTSGTDETGNFVPNSWRYYFTGSTDRNPATINFYIDNGGRVASGFPSQRVSCGYESGIDAYSIKNESGDYMASVGRASKVLTAAGGVQIGSGSALLYLNSTSSSTSVGTLAPFETRDIVELPLNGARIGDIATAHITSGDGNLRSVGVSAIVYNNNTVVLRAYNKTNASITPPAFAFVIKVERY